MAGKKKKGQLNNGEAEAPDLESGGGQAEGLSGGSDPPAGSGKQAKGGRRSKGVDRHYKRMEWQSKFWNKVDPLNKFRHWYLGKVSLTRSLFRVTAAWQTIVILLSILVILYIMAAFYTGKGEFVVKVDRPMADDGFLIAEEPSFGELLVTLRNDAAEDVTNISLDEIPRDVMNVDGKHNGENYVAYTFYLKNHTGSQKSYQYQMTMNGSSKHVEKATWIMLYYNGKQKVYAMENDAGHPESLYRRFEIPFSELAADPDYMNGRVTNPSEAHVTDEVAKMRQMEDKNGLYELKTIPWESDDVVCTGYVDAMEVDEVDKFTVVIWLEGDDPDCTDELWGGHVEFRMLFSYADDKHGGAPSDQKEQAGQADGEKEDEQTDAQDDGASAEEGGK